MGDTMSVSIDTSKDVAQPTLEEEAAKYEAPVPEEDRPDWLPEKFKSAKDLAKAYSELEKKMGSKPESKEAPAADNTADDESSAEEDKSVEEQAREATEKAGLDFDKLSEKYWTQGNLDESDYEALEKANIPKAIVDQFIAGQEAILNATKSQVFSSVGGEDAYNSMTEWAGDNFTKDEIAAYNTAVNSGNLDMAMMAVKGLKARYEAEVGFEPKREIRGANAKAGSTVYRSVAELESDMRDPRYKNDPAYRKDVERKLARSDIF